MFYPVRQQVSEQGSQRNKNVLSCSRTGFSTLLLFFILLKNVFIPLRTLLRNLLVNRIKHMNSVQVVQASHTRPRIWDISGILWGLASFSNFWFFIVWLLVCLVFCSTIKDCWFFELSRFLYKLVCCIEFLHLLPSSLGKDKQNTWRIWVIRSTKLNVL